MDRVKERRGNGSGQETPGPGGHQDPGGPAAGKTTGHAGRREVLTAAVPFLILTAPLSRGRSPNASIRACTTADFKTRAPAHRKTRGGLAQLVRAAES